MDDVRIQIVNYRTKSYLLRCLESVFKDLRDSTIKFTVAILDNASGDDLSDIAQRFPGMSIKIHMNSRNVGFGAGHNILARTGAAKYLLLLNPDTEIVEPDTVARLLRRPEISGAEIVGPHLITAKGDTQHWDHGELHGFMAWLALNTGHAYWREKKDVGDVAWVSGAVFLIEKKRFDRLHGFDENFFLYNEELELAWRLRADGGKVFYDPTITVLHHGGVVANKADYLRASNKYFLQKHFRGRIDYPLLLLLNAMLH